MTQREPVGVGVRRKVRRLLAMYGYPPDLSGDAAQRVLKQADLSTAAADEQWTFKRLRATCLPHGRPAAGA